MKQTIAAAALILAFGIASIYLASSLVREQKKNSVLEMEKSAALLLIDAQNRNIQAMEINIAYHKLSECQKDQIIDLLSRRWPEWEEIHKDKTCHEW